MTDSGGAVPVLTQAHRYRMAREYAGMEQVDLADALGVSRGTVSNAERGRMMSRATTIAWAMVTGVSLEWLEGAEAHVCQGKHTEPRPPRVSRPRVRSVRRRVGAAGRSHPAAGVA